MRRKQDNEDHEVIVCRRPRVERNTPKLSASGARQGQWHRRRHGAGFGRGGDTEGWTSTARSAPEAAESGEDFAQQMLAVSSGATGVRGSFGIGNRLRLKAD